MTRLKTLVLAISVMAISSCATPPPLPTSSQGLDFESIDGRIEPAIYRQTYRFPKEMGINVDKALKTAKAGLAYAGFIPSPGNLDEKFITGEGKRHWDGSEDDAAVFIYSHGDVMRAKIYTNGPFNVKNAMLISQGMDRFIYPEYSH